MADSAQSRVIMVVDDEPAVLAFTIQVLTDHGYQVLAANNGMEAIAKSRRQEGAIALLLTDVVMEDLNGPNLAEHLLTVNPACGSYLCPGGSRRSSHMKERFAGVF